MTALSFLAQHVITRYVTIKPPRADLEIYPPHAGDLSTHVPGRSIEIPRPWTPEATGVPVRRLPQITVHEGAPPVQAPRLEGYVPHVRAPREGLLESRQYDDQWRKQKDQALEERIVAILEREQSVDKTIGTLLAIEDRYRQLLRAHDDRVDRTDYSPGSDGYGQFLDDAIFKLHVVTATLIASRQYGLKALSAQYGKSIYDEQWLARPENSEARNAVENLRTQGRSEKILDIVREHLRQGDLDREGGVIDIMNDMLKKLFTDADEEFY
ncbi:MAG TPA: hypothetical protein PLQ67_02815 [Burkholderiaceae bacterium]|nr:hypothetical protein [Burkholderiaceae bacterium]